MFRDLETGRLLLKSIGFDDVDFIYKEFSTDAVNEFLFDAEPMTSPDDARELIEFYSAPEPRTMHRWILILKETGEKIGTCGFHCWDAATACAEVGYDLQPQYWQKGFMSEALAAILPFAKDEMGVRTLYAHIAERNTASQRTAEKLGFIKSGRTLYEEFRGKKYLHDIYERKL